MKSALRGVGACALLGAATLLAAPALATEPSSTELAIARRLFKEATDLELERQWARAASRLKEAVQIKDTPGLRFHLAHCEEQLGQLVEAMLDYERARDLIAAGARAEDVESLLTEARRALEARIPTLVIRVPEGVTDVTVELNGKPQARSVVGRPAPLNPGEYHVVVNAPGYRSFERTVVLAEGERKQIEAKLSTPIEESRAPLPGPVAPPRPKQAASPPENSHTLRNVLLVTESAVALAGLGVGIGFWVASSSSEESAKEARAKVAYSVRDEPPDVQRSPCVDPQREPLCEALNQAIDDHNRNQLWSTVGFIGAGVGVAAFVLTATLWPDAEGTTAPRVTALAAQDGALLGFSGRF